MTTKSKTKKESSIKPSKRSPSSSNKTGDSPLPIEARRFVRRVQNFSARQQLWKYGDSFLLCVSGGPDSVCLLDILAYLQRKYAFRITLAHVNYGLRGKDSDSDELFVKTLACRYDFPLFILRPKILSKSNLEERLRDIRYRFFEKIRKETNSQHIVTAHHEDDQAETFLIHLFRGSGLRGLSAMRPKNGALIRPLLNTSRSEILHYLSARQLSFRTDKTNFSDLFLRNKIRNKLFPLLEKEYAPKLRKRLAKTAALIAEDLSFLEKNALASSKKILLDDHSFSLNSFSRLSLAERRLFLSTLFRSHTKKPGGTWILETEKMLSSSKRKNQVLAFPGLKILRKGDTVRLIRL